MEFYRYKLTEYASHDYFGELIAPAFPNPKLELETYYLARETPKGYWIKIDYYPEEFWRKWVSKTSKKRFAYPTEEEALNNFIKRSKARIKILKRQVIVSEIGLSLAENKKIKDEEEKKS